MPYCPVIHLQDDQQIKLITFLLCGNTQPIEDAFARDRQYWLTRQPLARGLSTGSARSR